MNQQTRRSLDKINICLASPLDFVRHQAETEADILMRSAPTAKALVEIQAKLASYGMSTAIRYL